IFGPFLEYNKHGMPANFFGDPNVHVENGLELEVKSDGNLFITNPEETIQYKPVLDFDGGVFELEYVSPEPKGREELIYLTASDSFIHLVKFVKEDNREYITLNSFTENHSKKELASSVSVESEEKVEKNDLTEEISPDGIAVLQELTELKEWHLFGDIILDIGTGNINEEHMSYKSFVNFLNFEIDKDLVIYFKEYLESEEAKKLFASTYVDSNQNKDGFIIGANEVNGFYEKGKETEIRSLPVPTLTEYDDIFLANDDGMDKRLYIKKENELYVISNDSEKEIIIYQFLLEDDERFDSDFLTEYFGSSDEVIEEPKGKSVKKSKKEVKINTPSESNENAKSTKEDTNNFYNNDNIADNIYPAIVSVVKQAVEHNERITGAKFPWSYDDYNINSLGGDMYNTTGQFSHNGFTYTFELIIFMRPDTSGRVEFYNVY
ncbi:hypothetical protein, partial [Globicatella sp. HMSC072A10]|uniref:hypothetical protein n=1 Tax=Globicatella sp. HMSC072A10 TaxID=1739315 RepID=UPI00143BE409